MPFDMPALNALFNIKPRIGDRQMGEREKDIIAKALAGMDSSAAAMRRGPVGGTSAEAAINPRDIEMLLRRHPSMGGEDLGFAADPFAVPDDPAEAFTAGTHDFRGPLPGTFSGPPVGLGDGGAGAMPQMTPEDMDTIRAAVGMPAKSALPQFNANPNAFAPRDDEIARLADEKYARDALKFGIRDTPPAGGIPLEADTRLAGVVGGPRGMQLARSKKAFDEALRQRMQPEKVDFDSPEQVARHERALEAMEEGRARRVGPSSPRIRSGEEVGESLLRQDVRQERLDLAKVNQREIAQAQAKARRERMAARRESAPDGAVDSDGRINIRYARTPEEAKLILANNQQIDSRELEKARRTHEADILKEVNKGKKEVAELESGSRETIAGLSRDQAVQLAKTESELRIALASNANDQQARESLERLTLLRTQLKNSETELEKQKSANLIQKEVVEWNRSPQKHAQDLELAKAGNRPPETSAEKTAAALIAGGRTDEAAKILAGDDPKTVLGANNGLTPEQKDAQMSVDGGGLALMRQAVKDALSQSGGDPTKAADLLPKVLPKITPELAARFLENTASSPTDLKTDFSLASNLFSPIRSLRAIWGGGEGQLTEEEKRVLREFRKNTTGWDTMFGKDY